MRVESSSFVKVYGAVYMCALRYVSVKALDPLLALVHDALLDEPSIERLITLFNLPVRLIEDILAELISRNLAMLDVARGRVTRLDGARPAPAYRFRTEKSYWQDHYTGAILPVWVARTYRLRRQDAFSLSGEHSSAA